MGGGRSPTPETVRGFSYVSPGATRRVGTAGGVYVIKKTEEYPYQVGAEL